MSKKRLGRGLDALLSEKRAMANEKADAPSAVDVQLPGEEVPATMVAKSPFAEASVAEIVASPYQPRRHFDETALNELADSIRRQGLLQPLVVRERPTGGYELIAGERRWRAAQLAGLTEVPVVVRVVTDAEASAFALIENIQREDLTAMEEAQGLARLRDEFELTQQQIADAVGKSRVAIANLLRLLNLRPVAKRLLENGDIDMGHARALLGLEGSCQDDIAHQVAEQGLTVRQTEELVRRAGETRATGGPRPSPPVDPDTRRLEQRLTDQLGAPVSIKQRQGGKGGQVVIRYTSLEELDGVLRHLGISSD